MESTAGRLWLAGLHLFAEHGYARTSVRDLAEAAGCNVAAVAYHYQDKAGLYRALFDPPPVGLLPCTVCGAAAGETLSPAMGLEEGLARFYDALLAPLRAGELGRQLARLHFREAIEPSGIWPDGLAEVLQPLHGPLRAFLAGHCSALDAAERERLLLMLLSLGVHLYLAESGARRLAPELYDAPDAAQAWQRELTRAGVAIVRARLAAPRAAAAGGGGALERQVGAGMAVAADAGEAQPQPEPQAEAPLAPQATPAVTVARSPSGARLAPEPARAGAQAAAAPHPSAVTTPGARRGRAASNRSKEPSP